jgi:phosphate-selective porin OprO/OprP
MEFQEDTMRYISYAAATILLVAGLASAQSTGVQPASLRSTSDQNSTQQVVRVADKSDVQARLDALERKLDLLENRVNAVVPGTSAAAPQEMGDRLNALDQKLNLLEHNAQVKEGPTVTAGRDTFSISSPDKTFRLRIGGHFQLDGKSFHDDKNNLVAGDFNIRRARPIFEGNLGRFVDFRFMPEFGNGQSSVYDAYADIKAEPYAILRGGKFKTPMGLEILQNDADRSFIEQSLVSDLLPNRDEGFQLWGKVINRFTYQAAVLNGAPDGTNIDGLSTAPTFTGSTATPSGTHNGKDVVGRIFATPFKDSNIKFLQGLGFGIAGASGRQDEGAVLPSFKTTGGQATFFSFITNSAISTSNKVTLSYPYTFAAGRRLSYTPQAYYYYGPFGLMAEMGDTQQRVGLSSASNKTIVKDLDNHAWQVAGSWVITGEKKTYKSVVPRKGLEFDGDKGPGAWEVVARYTELNVDPAAFKNFGSVLGSSSAVRFADPTKSSEAARAWCVGVNWYLNYFTKMQFEYEQTHFQGGASTTVGSSTFLANRQTEKAIMERLQIAF